MGSLRPVLAAGALWAVLPLAAAAGPAADADGRGEDLIRDAAARSQAAGDPCGEARSRARLLRLLAVGGRPVEAAEEAARAESAAGACGDFALLATVALEQGRCAIIRSDAGAAWSHLRGLELRPGFDELSPDFRGTVLSFLAIVSGQLGLEGTSLAYRTKLMELADAHGLLDWQAGSRAQLALAAQRAGFRGDITRAEALAMAREALAFAEQDSSAMAGPGRFVARLRVASLAGGREALEMLEEMATGASADSSAAYHVQAELGRLFLGDPSLADPDRALEHLRLAVRAAAASGSLRDTATALSLLAGAELEHGVEGGLERARHALAAIESLHEAQSGERAAALLLARYAPIYYALLDALADRGEVEAAVQVSERLRARTLLDHLARIRGVDPGGPAGAGEARLRQERRQVLERIADVQLRLMAPDLPATAEQAARTELERLSVEEERLRAASPWPEAVPAAVPAPEVAALQAALAPDQAILSWLLPPDPEVGAWLFALTSDDVRAYPLPAREEVAVAGRFWLGLIRRRDGGESGAAARLGERLLGHALEDLPSRVRRLILVPDGPLHHLPLDLLQPGPDSPPLLQAMETSLAASAVLWLRLRETAGRHRPAAGGALFLADPGLPGRAGEPQGPRLLRGRASLGPLPHAREEAQLALQALDRPGEVLLGPAASEAALKSRDLGRLQVLHLAAHALVDDVDPARSAVLLTPGGEGEDGLLQPREILDMDLDGALVTLSACRSGGGPALDGEGVLGLARAFFLARAEAVVGSLWPVRDDETARLMVAFYRRLAGGASVEAALAGAKRQQRAAGAPAAAWAGFAAFGHASGPFPPLRQPSGQRLQDVSAIPLALLAAGLLALTGAVAIRRFRRRRRALPQEN